MEEMVYNIQMYVLISVCSNENKNRCVFASLYNVPYHIYMGCGSSSTELDTLHLHVCTVAQKGQTAMFLKL